MYILYLFVAVLGIFVCIFFLTRSMITLISFFSKSPFVPSEVFFFKRGLELLNLEKGDRFLDIGCGDGRVVFACEKEYPNLVRYGGIERISLLVFVANLKRLFREQKEKIFFKRADARKYDYTECNKVFMYLLPEFVAELMPMLEKQLPPKSIVVSIAFVIPEKYSKTGALCVHEVQVGRKTKKIYVWKKN